MQDVTLWEKRNESMTTDLSNDELDQLKEYVQTIETAITQIAKRYSSANLETFLSPKPVPTPQGPKFMSMGFQGWGKNGWRIVVRNAENTAELGNDNLLNNSSKVVRITLAQYLPLLVLEFHQKVLDYQAQVHHATYRAEQALDLLTRLTEED